MHTFVRFLQEEAGFMVGPEWAFVTTVLVLGAITATLALTYHTPDEVEALPLPAAKAHKE